MLDLYFNPRAPCGARLFMRFLTANAENFNPRAPCGARLHTGSPCTIHQKFQPTRPLRGATCVQDGVIYDS